MVSPRLSKDDSHPCHKQVINKKISKTPMISSWSSRIMRLRALSNLTSITSSDMLQIGGDKALKTFRAMSKMSTRINLRKTRNKKRRLE